MKNKIMNKDLFEPQNSVSLVGAVIEYGRYIVVKKDGKKQLERNSLKLSMEQDGLITTIQ